MAEELNTESEESRSESYRVNLLAALSAYDERQAGMDEDEKRAMNQRVVGGFEDFTIGAEGAERRRAAVRLAELGNKSIKEGERDVQALKDATEIMDSLGIRRLLEMLGSDQT